LLNTIFVMAREAFVLTFVVISMGARCMSTPTPNPLQGTRDGKSGIKGTTRSIVVSGVRGGPTTGGPASVEFAIAPVEADKPLYEKVRFVTSDARGQFEVELHPGKYWIGPKAKALDPGNYDPGSVVLSEMIVAVKEGTFISIELVQTGYLP
jgi:hypothetical protein